MPKPSAIPYANKLPPPPPSANALPLPPPTYRPTDPQIRPLPPRLLHLPLHLLRPLHSHPAPRYPKRGRLPSGLVRTQQLLHRSSPLSWSPQLSWKIFGLVRGWFLSLFFTKSRKNFGLGEYRFLRPFFTKPLKPPLSPTPLPLGRLSAAAPQAQWARAPLSVKNCERGRVCLAIVSWWARLKLACGVGYTASTITKVRCSATLS